MNEDTKTFRFQGSSDDIFSEHNVVNEEWGCYNKPVVILLYQGPEHEDEDTKPKYGLVVTGNYGDNDLASWSISIAPYDEDYPVDWDVRMKVAERGYSMLCEITCPSDVKLKLL